jgi:phenylpropionate dioxygenase-like ring-hydroxylating dioxygenase large terminal subunit
MRDEFAGLPDYLKLFARLAETPGRRMSERTQTASIDPAIYVDAERFARERALFRRSPIVLAHSGELREPGAVLALDRLGTPVLLMRARDGRVRAFLNACRHRNTRLVKPEESGRRASVVCPYHSWTYGLDGALLNIPCQEQFPGVVKAERGLFELPCEERCGLVFVLIEPGGAANGGAGARLGSLGEDLDAFGVGAAHVFRKIERTKRANWKLVVDAFEDGYHIQHLHRHTIAPFFKDSCSIAERVEDNIRSLVARIPFDEARALAPSQWNMREHVTYSHYVFPNLVTIVSPDYMSLIGLFPLSAGETLYTHTMLTPNAPRDEKEREHYERSWTLLEDGVFQAEDLDVCERAQAAIEGGAAWPMTLGAYEEGIVLFHAILDEALARL